MDIELGYETEVRASEAETLPIDGVICFRSQNYRLSELVVTAQNGEKSIRAKTKNGNVDISPLLFAGVLQITVHLIANGKPVKRWDIVPIVLHEVDNGFSAFDEIAELKARIEALEKKTTLIV